MPLVRLAYMEVWSQWLWLALEKLVVVLAWAGATPERKLDARL